jgi:hypothetical protein
MSHDSSERAGLNLAVEFPAVVAKANYPTSMFGLPVLLTGTLKSGWRISERFDQIKADCLKI